MCLSPGLGQSHLKLSLREARLLLFTQGINTPMAAHTLRIARMFLISLGDWPPAGMTLVIAAALQTMIDRNPVVKYKTFTFPQALLFWHFFQILQDAAFKVINLFKALLSKVSRGLFTTNAAGTEHGDFFMFRRVEVLFYVFGKFTKRIRGGVNGVLEGANFNFVLVTGINKKHVRV